jgi:hypothetical protein
MIVLALMLRTPRSQTNAFEYHTSARLRDGVWKIQSFSLVGVPSRLLLATTLDCNTSASARAYPKGGDNGEPGQRGKGAMM